MTRIQLHELHWFWKDNMLMAVSKITYIIEFVLELKLGHHQQCCGSWRKITDPVAGNKLKDPTAITLSAVMVQDVRESYGTKSLSPPSMTLYYYNTRLGVVESKDTDESLLVIPIPEL